MLTGDYTFQFKDDGVVLNEDPVVTSTPTGNVVQPFVDVNKVSGLDNAEFRMTERVREGMDGGFVDVEFENMRTIVLEGMLYASPTNLEPYLDQLKGNFGPTQESHPFYFVAPGVGQRTVFAKSLGMRYDWDQVRRTGKGAIQIQLKAEDPSIYGSALSSTVSLAAAAAAGIGFNLAFNLDFGGGGEGGTVSAHNSGNKPTPAIIRITGANEPKVTHENTDRHLDFNLILQAGDFLDIDLRNRSVRLNGTANRRGTLKPGSRWFMLEPGDNFIRFTGAPEQPLPSQMVVSYRPAYR